MTGQTSYEQQADGPASSSLAESPPGGEVVDASATDQLLAHKLPDYYANAVAALRECERIALREESSIDSGAPLCMAKIKRIGRTTAMTIRTWRQHTRKSGGVCPFLRGVSAYAG
jgi:hypothetical protein